MPTLKNRMTQQNIIPQLTDINPGDFGIAPLSALPPYQSPTGQQSGDSTGMEGWANLFKNIFGSNNQNMDPSSLAGLLATINMMTGGTGID